jgi:hypothetical protein
MATDKETAPKSSKVNSSIRIVLSVLAGIILGIFMLIWDAKFLAHESIPDWLGPFVFSPLIAVGVGFGLSSLIQQLSCGQVQWLVHLQRIAIVPVPFIITWFILYMVPSLRWPIEGLIQSGSPELKRGLSSGFYSFWLGLYCQSVLNNFSQLCPT